MVDMAALDTVKTLEMQRLPPADLDPELFRPDAACLEFLHKNITKDDELLKSRAIKVAFSILIKKLK